MEFEYSLPEPANYSLNVEHEKSALDGVVYDPVIKVINSSLPSLEDVFALLPNLNGTNPNFDPSDVLTFLKLNPRFTAALTFSIFMVVVLPFAGLTWCIMKVCSNTRRGRNNERGQNDGLLIGVAVLLLWIIPILFGMIGVSFYFMTNIALQQGIEAFPKRLDIASKDVNLFLNHTVKQLDHLTTQNINELTTGFDSLMVEAGTNVTDLVKEIQRDIEYDKLIHNSMSVLNDTLELNDITIPKFKNLTDMAQISVDDFKRQASQVEIKIDKILGLCSQPPQVDCSTLKSLKEALQLPGLDLTAISPSPVPEATLRTLESLKNQINKVDDTMASFSGDIVDDFALKVKEKVSEIQMELQEQVKKVTGDLGSANLIPTDVIPQTVLDISENLALGLIAPMVIFAIALAFIVIGSLLGCCGSQGGNVKSCGANFFVVSLVIFFIFGSILWAITGIGFFAGAIIERAACQTLRDPSSTPFGENLDSILQTLLQDDLGFQTNLTLSKMLESCRGDGIDVYNDGIGVYNLFQMKSIFDVDQWVNQFNMSQVSDDIMKLVVESFDAIIKETGSIDFSSQDISETTKNLDNLKVEIEKVFSIIPMDKIDAGIDSIQTIINSLAPADTSEFKDLLTMIEDLKNSQELISLNTSLANIETCFKESFFNDGEFVSNQVPLIVELVNNATKTLSLESKQKVEEVTKRVIERVEDVVYKFIDFGVTTVKEDIGRCGPIGNIYDDLLITSFCEEVVNPFNGQWSQLGLGLLFMIPGFFLMCSLDGLFRKGKRETRSRYYDEEIYKDMAGYPKARVSLPMEEMPIKQIPDHYKGRLNKTKQKY